MMLKTTEAEHHKDIMMCLNFDKNFDRYGKFFMQILFQRELCM